MYEAHLRAVIAALKAHDPQLSNRRLSREAGLNPSWVSAFLSSGSATLESADNILRVAALRCPDGPEGDALRALLAAFDELDATAVAA